MLVTDSASNREEDIMSTQPTHAEAEQKVRELIKDIKFALYKAWFPEGKDDPLLCCASM